MMMLLTIIMLIASLVSVIQGGLNAGVMKNYNKYYYVDDSDKLVRKDGVNPEQDVKAVIQGCLFIIMASILVVLQVAFFISALSVDVFVIPTVAMILLFVYGVIKSLVRKKKKTNKEIMENKPSGLFKRLLFLAYIIYIFILIVI